MKHAFENSTMLASCEYNNETKELTVTFANGKDYVYKDVDKSIYNALIGAASAGKYFNSVKGGLRIKKDE